jgi:hypothetical protein
MINRRQIMQRYLLGELSEIQQATLENEYFRDRRVFDQVVQLETELVDKYARGLLSPAERERFEQHYLAHPIRLDRANFATALAAKIDQTTPVEPVLRPDAESLFRRIFYFSPQPMLAWISAVAILFLSAGVVWFFVENRGLRDQVALQQQREQQLQQQTTRDREYAEQLAAELERQRELQRNSSSPPPEPKRAPTFASLILTVAGTRGSESAAPSVLVVPSGTNEVRLQLKLRESSYPSYRAVLQLAGGPEMFAWRRTTIHPHQAGATVFLTLPAEKLASGDYVLTLRGVNQIGEVEDVSKSLFRVERK